MKRELANIKQFSRDVSRHGIRHMVERYAEVNRPYAPAALGVDAVAFGLVWLAWGQHGKAVGIPLIAIAVGLMIFGGMVAGSGVEYGARSGAGTGNVISGRHAREHMGSNQAWSQAQRNHRQSVTPTAHALFLASLLPLVIGLVLWGLGI